MGLFNKNKFNKLKREDIVAAILQLQEQQRSIEEGLSSKQKEISAFLEQGRHEADRQTKIFYAKKINSLKEAREAGMKRVMYLMYNLQLLEKLKDAIEDKEFITSVGNVPLNSLLQNQSELTNFLKSALSDKIRSEDIMTATNEVFNDVNAAYEPSQSIYGMSEQDDELLAMFEKDEALNDEYFFSNSDGKTQNKDNGIDKKESI